MVEHLKNSALPRAFADVVGDLADLVQKEIHLAKAELSEKLSAKLRAGVWIGVAAGLGLIAALLVIEGIVFGIATFGIALHWSCLIVAAVLAAAAATAYAKGSADAREELTPTRTIRQVKRDIATAKEQLT
jgi:putative superfamily III holin-X